MQTGNRRIGQLKTYDPRTKLYLLVGYLLITCISWNLITLMINLFMAVLLILLSRTSFQRIASSSIGAFAIEIPIAALMIIPTSVMTGLYIMLKLLLLTMVYNAMINAMDQPTMLDGLSKGFGFSAGMSKKLSIILTYSTRVYKERVRVVKAQKARGLTTKGISIWTSIRRQLILMIPIHKSAITRSKRQSTAMQMRGYTSVRRRNPISSLAFTWVDELVLLIMLLFIMLCLLLMIIL